MRRPNAVMLAVCSVLLWACDEAATPGESAPVVVYASSDDTTFLPQLFDEYTRATGSIVIVRHGEPDAMVDDVIDGGIDPPADVLLTPGVAGVWRAADEGALRPLQSSIVTARVLPWLRDPDGFWTALNYRRAVIVYDTDQVNGADVGEFDSLAEPGFEGKLCLAQADISISLAVIAHLINDIGVRDTELMVRGWVNNLAMPAFASEADVMRAIAEQRCAIGVVSSDAFAAAALADPDVAFGSFEPATPYADIEGIGIARHARNPDGARQLVEWMLGPDLQDRLAAARVANTATTAIENSKPVSLVAYYREDALKLVERARYR